MATGPLDRAIDFTALASSRRLRMAASDRAPAQETSRISALEQSLQMIIAARKVGEVPPLLADAIDLAEQVLIEGITFPPANGIVAGPVALSHRVPLLGASPAPEPTGE